MSSARGNRSAVIPHFLGQETETQIKEPASGQTSKYHSQKLLGSQSQRL